MNAPRSGSRQHYQSWVQDQIEEHKSALARDELLDIAEEAITRLFDSPDGQYPLTEILLGNAVDSLLFERLGLPDYRQWRRTCRSDTPRRPRKRTAVPLRVAG